MSLLGAARWRSLLARYRKGPTSSIFPEELAESCVAEELALTNDAVKPVFGLHADRRTGVPGART